MFCLNIRMCTQASACEGQKRALIPWHCSHGWLSAAMWVLRTKQGSSARVTSALSH